MKKNIFLSIIIPVYNEETRISHIIKVGNYLAKQKFISELIVVDDGSTDATKKKLVEYQKSCPLSIISYKTNRGKGFAVKTGMLKSRGEYRLFSDIDLSVPIETIGKFIKAKDKADLLLGTRRQKNSQILVHQSIVRENLGRLFTTLSQWVTGTSISDFTCGFKWFNQKAAKAIFSRTRIDGWGCDSEIVFIASRLGLKISEFPVTWKNDPQTKVRIPGDIIRSLRELVEIRLNNLQGLYR